MRSQSMLRHCRVLEVGCVMILAVTDAGCGRGDRGRPVDERLVGTWMSHIKQNGNDSRTSRLQFAADGRLWYETVLEKPPNRWTMLIRAVCQPSGDNRITVTMQSKRSGAEISAPTAGEDVLKPEENAPQEWQYRFGHDGSLTIERPGATGIQKDVFHKET